MWFKNVRLYTVDLSQFKDIFHDDAAMEETISKVAFKPCAAQETATIGFAPLFGKDTPFHFSCGENHYFKLIEENKLLCINSLNSRKRVVSELQRRFKAVSIAFWDSYLQMDERAQRVALMYVLLKTYQLLFDILYHRAGTQPRMACRTLRYGGSGLCRYFQRGLCH